MTMLPQAGRRWRAWTGFVSVWLAIAALSGCAADLPVDNEADPPARHALNATRRAHLGERDQLDRRHEHHVANEVLVQLADDSSRGDPARQIANLSQLLGAVSGEPLPSRSLPGGRLGGTRGHWGLLRISPDQDPADLVTTLGTFREVISAQLNYRYIPHATPSDPEFSAQWAHAITEAELGWDIQTGDANVVVAVIGVGVALTHPDLDDNLWTNEGEVPGNGIDDDGNGFTDDVAGWDFAANDNDPSSIGSETHETKVAGIVAAEANNGTGGVGAAWNASIMPLRVGFTSSTVAAAIDYAVANGASIINMSFGSQWPFEYGPDSLVEQAVVTADAANVVVVASAGNENLPTLQYPAALPLVLAVGATTKRDERASFSNYGDWIAVAGPGVELLTTTTGGDSPLFSGTSASAPYVAGVAALVRSQHPTWSAQQIRRVLEYSGNKLDTYRFVGSTRINVLGALTSPGPPFARIKSPRANDPFGDEVVEIHGTAIGDNHVLEWRLSSATSWTLATSGSSIVDGLIGTIDLTGLPPTGVIARLSVTLGPTTVTDQLTIYKASASPTGWPVASSGDVTVAPTFGDIDGDGVVEIVIADDQGVVRAFHVDGTLVSGWPQIVSGTMIPQGSPALADLDGDGDVEIVATFTDYRVTFGQVHVWHHTGVPVGGWPRTIRPIASGPVLADLDQDGDPEIVAVENSFDGYPTRIHAWVSNGGPVPGWPVAIAGSNETDGVAADLEADGIVEIAIATGSHVHLHSADGTPVAGWPVPLTGNDQAGLVAGDIDGDGVAEIIAAGTSTVTVLRSDGNALSGWPLAITSDSVRRPSLGDLDLDGMPDIIVGLPDGTVHAWRHDGSAIAGWPTKAGLAVDASALIADIDADGHHDVIAVSGDRLMHGWAADGSILTDFPKATGAPVNAAPALVDLDGDIDRDLVAAVTGDQKGAQAWQLQSSADPLAVEWGRSRHDPYNTGAYPRRFPLRAATVDPGRVVLSWDQPADIHPPRAYRVFRDAVLVAVTSGLSYALDVITPTTTFRYAVLAVDETLSTRARSLSLEASANVLPNVCAGKTDGDPCNDGNLCTTSERCQSGVCTTVSAITCFPGSDCIEASSCDPGVGTCSTLKAKTPGTPCAEGIGSCNNGSCIIAVDAGPDATNLDGSVDTLADTLPDGAVDRGTDSLDGGSDATIADAATDSGSSADSSPFDDDAGSTDVSLTSDRASVQDSAPSWDVVSPQADSALPSDPGCSCAVEATPAAGLSLLWPLLLWLAVAPRRTRTPTSLKPLLRRNLAAPTIGLMLATLGGVATSCSTNDEFVAGDAMVDRSIIDVAIQKDAPPLPPDSVLPLDIKPPPASGPDPVLFVHGVNGSGQDFSAMIDRLVADGWPRSLLFARDFADPSWGCNVNNANTIETWVADILASSGRSRIDIVAHSMGTLSSRHFIAKLGGDQFVNTYVTLGGMHHGLATPCLSPFKPCIWDELCQDGPFISQLNADPIDGDTVKWVSIFSIDDTTTPATSAHLDGAENIQVQGVDHAGTNGLLEASIVYPHVKRVLEYPPW